jgi:hypothetical protein
MTHWRTGFRTAVVAAGCVALAGCGSGSSGGQTAQVVRVDITTSQAGAATTLTTGSTLLLIATALDASNAPVSGSTFAWGSSNPGIATAANGLVTAVSAGTTNVTASVGTVTSAPFPIVVQPAVHPPSGAHVYFLQFEGQALTPGADNPTANVSQLVSQSVTIPPYLSGDAQRASKVQGIVAEVSTLLAPFDIAIVTSRPSTGAYDMLVAGGQSQAAGFPAGLFGVAPTDCVTTGHHVSLLFDPAVGHDAARQIVSALGETHAVPSSTAANDCMCDGTGCASGLTASCSIGGPGTPVSGNASCAAGSTMDERQLFTAAFGPHP